MSKNISKAVTVTKNQMPKRAINGFMAITFFPCLVTLSNPATRKGFCKFILKPRFA